MVFNKMDAAPDSVEVTTACGLDRPSVFVSALKGTGMDLLCDAVEEEADGFTRKVCVSAPPGSSRLVSFVRKTGGLISVGHEEDCVTVKARLRMEDIDRLTASEGIEVTLL